MQILSKYWINIGQILDKYWAIIGQIFGTYLTQNVQEFANIVQILCKYCTNNVHILLDQVHGSNQ